MKAISAEEQKGSPCEARIRELWSWCASFIVFLADSWKRRGRGGGEGEEGKEGKEVGDGRDDISSHATLLTYSSRLVDSDSLYGGWYWPQAEALAVHVNLHALSDRAQATTPT